MNTSDKVDVGILKGDTDLQVKYVVLTQLLQLGISSSSLPITKYLNPLVNDIVPYILPQELRRLFQRRDPSAMMSSESSTRDLIPFHPIQRTYQKYVFRKQQTTE